MPARATRSGAARVMRSPAEPDLARSRHEPGDGAERRRLAGAVPAEHGHDLALPHAQRHAVQRLNRPVARVDVLELEQRRHQSVVPR